MHVTIRWYLTYAVQIKQHICACYAINRCLTQFSNLILNLSPEFIFSGNYFSITYKAQQPFKWIMVFSISWNIFCHLSLKLSLFQKFWRIALNSPQRLMPRYVEMLDIHCPLTIMNALKSKYVYVSSKKILFLIFPPIFLSVLLYSFKRLSFQEIDEFVFNTAGNSNATWYIQTMTRLTWRQGSTIRIFQSWGRWVRNI